MKSFVKDGLARDDFIWNGVLYPWLITMVRTGILRTKNEEIEFAYQLCFMFLMLKEWALPKVLVATALGAAVAMAGTVVSVGMYLNLAHETIICTGLIAASFLTLRGLRKALRLARLDYLDVLRSRKYAYHSKLSKAARAQLVERVERLDNVSGADVFLSFEGAYFKQARKVAKSIRGQGYTVRMYQPDTNWLPGWGTMIQSVRRARCIVCIGDGSVPVFLAKQTPKENKRASLTGRSKYVIAELEMATICNIPIYMTEDARDFRRYVLKSVTAELQSARSQRESKPVSEILDYLAAKGLTDWDDALLDDHPAEFMLSEMRADASHYYLVWAQELRPHWYACQWALVFFGFAILSYLGFAAVLKLMR